VYQSKKKEVTFSYFSVYSLPYLCKQGIPQEYCLLPRVHRDNQDDGSKRRFLGDVHVLLQPTALGFFCHLRQFWLGSVGKRRKKFLDPVEGRQLSEVYQRLCHKKHSDT
jgi:hypothetical protein